TRSTTCRCCRRSATRWRSIPTDGCAARPADADGRRATSAPLDARSRSQYPRRWQPAWSLARRSPRRRTADAPTRSGPSARRRYGLDAFAQPSRQGLLERLRPARQEFVHRLLNRLPYLVGEVEHDDRVIGVALQMLGVDRRAELDQPFRRQRDQAERPEPRE